MRKYDIDFFKKFKLETPVVGLIMKVVSPRGLRRPDSDEPDGYAYRLTAEFPLVYNEGEATSVEPGIYHILDVCKPEEKLLWNHYLFIVEDDGTAYPIWELLEQKNTQWVKEALPIIKKVFANKPMDRIKITRYNHVVEEVHWGRFKK